MLIAHRGGSWEAPENTLQAFNYALMTGAQFLETDVRITKDGHIIVCHDEDFKRLCGDPRKVKEVNLNELPNFK
jgi:glycerophosphoryl diester phosphodiesterase